MIIATIADIHFPLYSELFLKSIEKVKEPDLLLLAGDICDVRKKEEYRNVLDKIKWKCPIVACFGNTEFEQECDDIRKIAKEVKFLEDESLILKIKGKEIGIVGTKGSLDQPTWWQLKYVKNIRKIYSERVEKIRKLLSKLNTEIKILLMHYSPTYKTLEGEKKEIWGNMGCKKFEFVIKETKPTLVIHGHAHRGKRLAFINSIPVFNVGIEVNNGIVEIDLDNLPKSGLKKFA